MGKIINPNLKHLYSSLKAEKSGAVLEGSSRSGKTWACIDFLIMICTIEDGATINIIKETYNSFKTTIFEDLNRRLPMFGIESPCANVQEMHSFKLFGNKINIIGADRSSKFQGVGCDYFWINESVYVAKQIFDQQEMRCRKFWWMDYNPSFSKHYIYDSVITRSDVSYLKTTFSDNPFVSAKEKSKILSYDPSNEKNVIQGTADEYMWKVFGLGERVSPEGVVFPNWRIRPLPEDLKDEKPLLYWLDFGYSNDPCAIGKIWKYKGELWLDEICYQTGLVNCINSDNPQQDSIQQVFIDNGITADDIIVADSAEQKSIAELRLAGFQVIPIKKEGVVQGINRLKRHIVNLSATAGNLIHEKDSYSWKKNNLTNELSNNPIDANNHHMDGARYGVKFAEDYGMI